MKGKSAACRLLLLLFIALFLCSACMVFRTAAQARREQQAFAELEAEAASSAGTPAQAGEEMETGETTSPYEILKERNPDFFGWLSIPGTVLDYPVMHTPEDEEYYLHRNFDGGDSQSGVPFLAADCFEGCGNYLIYGHNMKNGTMFATLLSYADREYWEQHPTICLSTSAGDEAYTVLAAFYSEAYPQDAAGVFRYYRYTDLREAGVFEEYVEQVRAAALYDTGVSAAYGDQLLTLSTCSYHTSNGRFVVVARKDDSSLER